MKKCKKRTIGVAGLLILVGLFICTDEVFAIGVYSKQANSIIEKNSGSKGVVNGQRFRVLDTTAPVYRSIVRIPTNDYASGFVIGRDKILTSAHVSQNTPIGATIVPGLNENEHPFGEFQVTNIDIPDGWWNNWRGGGARYDYSVVTVAPNAQGEYIGDIVEPLSLKTTTISDLISIGNIRLLGYPRDKGSEQLWDSPGKLLRYDGFFGDDAFNEQLSDLGNHFLEFDADSSWGNSGGPVLNSRNEVIGVVNLDSDNGPGFGNGAVLLEPIVVDWIESKLR